MPEPTDPLLAEFHSLRLFTPEEWEEARRRQVWARSGTVVAWLMLAASIAATTSATAYYAGRAAEARYTIAALDLATGYRAALEASVSVAERTLPVCLQADERLHEVLRKRAGVVWRVEP